MEVRAGLEVVIPHHDVVKQLIGPTLFDALVALSKGDANSSAVGAVVTTLGEVLDSSTQSQQHALAEQKHDDDPFAAFEDDTPMETVVRAIAAEEKYSDDRSDEVTNTLAGQWIDTVGNLRALTEEDIKDLGLPPVVYRYLLRVKSGL